jgi:hypothetical protein
MSSLPSLAGEWALQQGKKGDPLMAKAPTLNGPPRATVVAPPASAPSRLATEQEMASLAGPFRRKKSETILAARERAIALAQAHIDLPDSPTERELEARRINEIADRIKSGLLLPCCWATVLYDGIIFRMNGNHSAHAIVEAAEFLPPEIVIHLDHYEADDAEGMGVLFRQFDARFSGRTKQDVAGAYQGLAKPLAGISRSTAKIGIEAVAWYLRNREKVAVPSNDNLYQEFLRPVYHGFLRWLNSILYPKTPELRRLPVIAAMYATFIASESGAQEFWSHVAKGDLSDDTDPRLVLSADLVAAIDKDKKDKEPLPPIGIYAKCLKGWASFRNGDKVRSLNVNPKKVVVPDVAA